MLQDVVRLHPEEQTPVLALVHTGRAAAVKRLHARIVRKVAVGADSRPWTDAESADALDTRASPVHRGRQAWIAQGWEAA
jgi:hypothetical protein